MQFGVSKTFHFVQFEGEKYYHYAVSYAKKSVAGGSDQKSLWVFLKRRHTRLNVVRKDVAFETVGVVVVA